MQFQVPQFIEVEDKIFGPFTFKQFIYMIGGLGAAYLLWRALPHFLAIPLIIGVGGLAAALAFMKLNGRPFILALEYGFYYLIHAKLYLWSSERKKKPEAATKKEPEKRAEVYMPKLSDSKLHELSWSLDIKERIAAGISNPKEREKADDVMAPVRTALGARIR